MVDLRGRTHASRPLPWLYSAVQLGKAQKLRSATWPSYQIALTSLIRSGSYQCYRDCLYNTYVRLLVAHRILVVSASATACYSTCYSRTEAAARLARRQCDARGGCRDRRDAGTTHPSGHTREQPKHSGTRRPLGNRIIVVPRWSCASGARGVREVARGIRMIPALFCSTITINQSSGSARRRYRVVRTHAPLRRGSHEECLRERRILEDFVGSCCPPQYQLCPN